MTQRELDPSPVTLDCDECNQPFTVKYSTYRKAKPGKSWRCRSCNDAYRKSIIDQMPAEERVKYLVSKNRSIQRGWLNRSSEDKRLTSQLRKKIWRNKTEEELISHKERGRQIWRNRDLVNKLDLINKLNLGRKKFWNNMTEESYKEWDQKRIEGVNKYISNIDMIPNKNEFSLIDDLESNMIPYQWIYFNQKIHPEFEKLFPLNPISGGNVSPYHAWDFILPFKMESILIDIDGSMHNERRISHYVTLYNGKRVKQIDLVKFNDSKRPYQTDGLNAYIIECYDDNLNDNTPVLSLQSYQQITYKKFILYLVSLVIANQVSDKEMKRFLRSI